MPYFSLWAWPFRQPQQLRLTLPHKYYGVGTTKTKMGVIQDLYWNRVSIAPQSILSWFPSCHVQIVILDYAPFLSSPEYNFDNKISLCCGVGTWILYDSVTYNIQPSPKETMESFLLTRQVQFHLYCGKNPNVLSDRPQNWAIPNALKCSISIRNHQAWQNTWY